MNALTIAQPWASLTAIGVRSIETRSWRPPASAIGERLVTHAAAMLAPDLLRDPRSLDSVFEAAGGEWTYVRVLGQAPALLRDREELPRGAVVASCVLADVVPIVGIDHDNAPPGTRYVSTTGDHAFLWPPYEENADDTLADFMGQVPFGDFTPGRFAWLLEDVKPTTERCPACWGAVQPREGGGIEAVECLVCWCLGKAGT